MTRDEVYAMVVACTVGQTRGVYVVMHDCVDGCGDTEVKVGNLRCASCQLKADVAWVERVYPVRNRVQNKVDNRGRNRVQP